MATGTGMRRVCCRSNAASARASRLAVFGSVSGKELRLIVASAHGRTQEMARRATPTDGSASAYSSTRLSALPGSPSTESPLDSDSHIIPRDSEIASIFFPEDDFLWPLRMRSDRGTGRAHLTPRGRGRGGPSPSTMPTGLATDLVWPPRSGASTSVNRSIIRVGQCPIVARSTAWLSSARMSVVSQVHCRASWSRASAN